MPSQGGFRFNTSQWKSAVGCLLARTSSHRAWGQICIRIFGEFILCIFVIYLYLFGVIFVSISLVNLFCVFRVFFFIHLVPAICIRIFDQFIWCVYFILFIGIYSVPLFAFILLDSHFYTIKSFVQNRYSWFPVFTFKAPQYSQQPTVGHIFVDPVSIS